MLLALGEVEGDIGQLSAYDNGADGITWFSELTKAGLPSGLGIL